MSDDLQKLIWNSILESATKIVPQVNNIDLWAKEVLGVNLHSNEIEIVNAVCDYKKEYLVIVGSRGSGKSFSTCVGLIKLALENLGLEIGVFGPRADQSIRIITETKKILANSKAKNRVDWDHTTAERLVFNNSSSMLALSAAETSLQEGFHFAICIVDECLDGKTLISLPNRKSISIEQLVEEKKENFVLSYNTETKKIESAKILNFKKMISQKSMVEVEFSGGQSIKCTEDHKFFTRRGWIQAQYLTSEDIVVEINGNFFIRIKKIISISNPAFVYDLEIEKTHCYFANNILVHNSQRISNLSMTQRILPMIGSKKIYKLIKIGIPLFKNHFFHSYSDPKYTVVQHDWLHSPILLESGVTEIDGIKYPSKVLDRMPRSLKTKMFPNHPEFHTDGDMSEIEFNTQYGMKWMDDVNTFLSATDLEKLVTSNHKILQKGRVGDDYFYGIDTASGSLMPGKYDLDFTSLSVWRKTGDNIKELVGTYEWQGGEILSQIEEIISIIHPAYGLFPCTFGLIDYSNVGITAVETLKREKVPVAGIMFAATEPSSHKNYKNALMAQFKFELQADRIKYPSLDEVETNNVFKKHYYQWVALEQHIGLGLNSRLSAPEGGHDDGCFSDSLAVYAADRNQIFKQGLPTIHIPSSMIPRSILSPRPGDNNSGKRFLT